METVHVALENLVNRRVDIWEDIKHYQDTLSYASSRADYSMRENIYIMPSDMNLSIMSGTVGYNNEIFVSDGTFSLGKNDRVNTLKMKEGDEPKVSHKVVVQPSITPQKQTMTHKEKSCLDTFLAGVFRIWYAF